MSRFPFVLYSSGLPDFHLFHIVVVWPVYPTYSIQHPFSQWLTCLKPSFTHQKPCFSHQKPWFAPQKPCFTHQKLWLAPQKPSKTMVCNLKNHQTPGTFPHQSLQKTLSSNRPGAAARRAAAAAAAERRVGRGRWRAAASGGTSRDLGTELRGRENTGTRWPSGFFWGFPPWSSQESCEHIIEFNEKKRHHQ